MTLPQSLLVDHSIRSPLWESHLHLRVIDRACYRWTVSNRFESVRQGLADSGLLPRGSAAEDDPSAAVWRTAVRHGLLAYLLSRAAVFLGAAIVAAEIKADDNKLRARTIWGLVSRPDPHMRSLSAPRSATSMVLDVLTSWDGIWYMRIVRFGYPHFVPSHITYEQTQARVAFFPAYPYLVRIVDHLLPGGDTFAALFLNLLLGALFIGLVGLLAREWFGVIHAQRAMILTALFPGSFVLSFAYSEALLLVLAAFALYLLLRNHWFAAGIVSMLATATRPNGVAVAVACFVAAVLHARGSKSLRPLIAPALAPLGFVLFQLHVDGLTSEHGVWFRVQSQAWDEGASFGFTAIHRTLQAFTRPLTSPTDLITAASFACAVFLVYLAWHHHRLPAAPAAYSAVVIALMLLPSTVTARPRFLFTAFPLLIATAVWLDDPRRREWWPYVTGMCLAGLTALTALYGVYGAIP